jgi:HEAT repeat protein
MKYLYTLIIFGFLSSYSYAQTDNRAVETKVADLLMHFPADNSADLLRITQQLSDIGPDAATIIARNLETASIKGAAQLKYALSGMVKYMSKEPKHHIVSKTGHALIKALMLDLTVENKNFLLEQLNYIAQEEHLPSLKSYLLMDEYADYTCRLMTNVGGPIANKLLFNGLTNASDFQKIHIIKALSALGTPSSLSFMNDNFESQPEVLKPVILNSFANHGYEAGIELIKNAAIKEGFISGVNTTTHAYLNTLERLSLSGKAEETKNVLIDIIKNTTSGAAVKIAALDILSRADITSATPILMSYVNGSDAALRQSSLNMIAKSGNSTLINQLMPILQSSKEVSQKVDLLQFFTKNKMVNGIPIFSKLIKDKNDLVKVAAMNALFANDEKNALTPIVALLKKSSPEVVNAAQSLLLRADKSSFNAVAKTQYSKTSTQGKLALMDLIGKRKSKEFSELIFKETSNKNLSIRNRAIAQLIHIAEPKNMNQLTDLLVKQSEKENISHIQNAIVSLMEQYPDEKNQLYAALPILTGNSNSFKFYNILAKSGTQEAQQTVRNDLKGNPQNIEYAIDAFNIWNKGEGLADLYTLVQSTSDKALKYKALAAYIRNVNRTALSEDQRLLLLRKVQNQIEENEHKIQLIRQVAQINTLQALNCISQYLDDTKTRQTSINSIFNIILNSNIYGTHAKSIIDKAIMLNTNSEAKYVEEAVIKKMTTWPKDEGYVSMFNGKDLSGWKGLVENPIARSKMAKDQLAAAQQKANDKMNRDWRVENGVLVFDAEGYDNLCSEKMYGDFELLVDWRMEAKGDGGVYLRGSPQVQTWDTSRRDAGAQVGSGGLYNNQKYQSKPLLVADNPINEWNTFRIKMIGDKVTVYLNGQLVTDNVILENYWDRSIPIFAKESIELQAHGTRLEFRDVYVKEIPRAESITLSQEEMIEGFTPLFNGIDLNNWTGNKIDYFAQEGMIVCQPSGKGNGNLFTEKEYDNFIMRFEFQLTSGANNGLGIRTSKEGDPAYVGMELQILDNKADIYKNLFDWQYHGSVYGVIAAKRDYLKPIGEWNVQEVYANGNHIKITLNGQVIVDGDIHKVSEGGKKTIDGKAHPGLLNKKGHIGFLGHGSPLKFRNIRIKELK